jgi:hypothetical protein
VGLAEELNLKKEKSKTKHLYYIGKKWNLIKSFYLTLLIYLSGENYFLLVNIYQEYFFSAQNIGTMDEIIIAICLVVILLIFYWGAPNCFKKERFNMNYHQSMLMKNMDYVQDKGGYTLDDYILANNVLTGQPVSSPF